MTFLSVFHLQGLELLVTAKYDIDGKKRVEVENELGNGISDNYNLFWFRCTSIHI